MKTATLRQDRPVADTPIVLHEAPRALRDQSGAAASLDAVTAAATAYLAMVVLQPAQLWYLPLTRAWTLGASPSASAMSWFGRSGITVAAALLGWHFPKRAIGLRWRVVAAAASLVLAIGICVHDAIHKPLSPLPGAATCVKLGP